MEGNYIKINWLLTPLSWLYGLAVSIRNLLFDTNVIEEKAYAIPVIAVGNITVGGTGKTPHVEYLIRLLRNHFRVAVLSRGYKRKSRGFLLAKPETPMQQLGDEPYQIKQKFPDVEVAVDKSRREGIDKLTGGEYTHDVDVVLLDDAFQHRYVKPGVNILLVDYHRLIIYDKLLPAGRLREPLKAKNRADIVIVTKCPGDLKPMEFRVLIKQMDLFPYQKLFFTTLEYDALQPVFQDAGSAIPLSAIGDRHVLLLTGIASPKQMAEDLESHVASLKPLTFGDHHNFRKKDIQRINKMYASLPQPAIIVTTEKDAARLADNKVLSDEVRRHLYALPVRIRFMLEGDEMFNENIIGYVRKNSRNSILAKRKDDNKSKDSDNSGDRPRRISFRDN